jgi:hypothetical protein
MTRGTRRAVAAGLAIVIIAITGVLVYAVWPARRPALDAPTSELVKFVTTDAFAALPDDKKMQYVQTLLDKGMPALVLAAAEAKLTEAQRQRGIDNAMQAGINVRMGQHLNAWLKLDEKNRREYVKRLIQENPNRVPGPGERPGMRGGQRMTPEQVKRFIENTSPDQRAAMAEFMAAVRKEREWRR